MILGMHSIQVVLNKTGKRCSICGCKENIVCSDFIPAWTRVVNNIDNQIPLCDACREERGLQFIELGKLKFLDETYLQAAMRFYRSNDKYLKYYVRRFGEYRSRGLIEIDHAMMILSSYDAYVDEHYDELNWEV